MMVGTTQETANEATSSYQKEFPTTAKRSHNTVLYVIIGILTVALIVFGFLMLKSDKEGSQEEVKLETQVENNDSPSPDADTSTGQSPKEHITKSLEELFENVVKGNTHEYNENYFSSDFKQIYNKVDELDERLAEEGYIGFWDFGFWDMAQDDVKMNIAVDDVYNIKDHEAMAKVTFKFTFDGQTETRNEEIKVIRESGRWVLDDLHGYKEQMKNYIEENKNY